MTTNSSFKELEDGALLEATRRLAAAERQATAALLRALMEVDGRRLYLGEGCASMFTYCTQVLHMAEGAAYNRIEAARTARRFPLILRVFEESAVTLTAIRLLAPHLTEENHVAVLASARHKTKREVEEVAARLRPRSDAPTIARKLPQPLTIERKSLADIPAMPLPPPCPPAPVATPLAPERFKIQFTVSRETHERFRRAQALLRHAIPSGDAGEIFDRALTLLVEKLESKRFAQTSRPRASRPSDAGSRYIPAAVRRAVWARDGGRCAFVGNTGRCAENAFLEFHHVDPYAVGGEATVENLQLRCRAHNVYEASLYFGDVVREGRAEYAMEPGLGVQNDCRELRGSLRSVHLRQCRRNGRRGLYRS